LKYPWDLSDFSSKYRLTHTFPPKREPLTKKTLTLEEKIIRQNQYNES